jgi:hypothetical protein
MSLEDLEYSSCDGAPEHTVSPVLNFISWMRLYCPPQGHFLGPPLGADGRPAYRWLSLNDSSEFLLLADPVLETDPPATLRHENFFQVAGFTALGMAEESRPVFDFAGAVYGALTKHFEVSPVPSYDEIYQYVIGVSTGTRYILFAYFAGENPVPHHFVLCTDDCKGMLLVAVEPAD